MTAPLMRTVRHAKNILETTHAAKMQRGEQYLLTENNTVQRDAESKLNNEIKGISVLQEPTSLAWVLT